MDKDTILSELQLKAIRSSGPGGQHANKVSSKVELLFDLANSNGLTEPEKHRLSLQLKSKLTKDSSFLLQCDTSRSQHTNKSLVTKRFFEILEKALQVPKKRKKTRPSKSAIEKRLTSKKKDAIKKANRGKPKLE